MRSIAHLRLGDATPEALSFALAACARVSSIVEPLESEVFLDLSTPGSKGLWRELWQEVAHIYPGATLGLATSRLMARIASGVALPAPAESKSNHPGVCAVHPGREAAFLAPLPVECLWLAEPSVRERLRRLGFCQIGQIAAVSANVLHQQFGQLGSLLQHWAHGQDPTPVQALYPPRILVHRISSAEHPLVDHASLAAAVGALASALAAELDSTHCTCGKLTLTLVGSKGCVYEQERVLTSCGLSSSRVEHAAVSLLRQMSLKEPVAEVTLSASELVPARPVQAALFASGTGSSAKIQPHLEETMAKLRRLYGASAVRTAAALAPTRRELFMEALERSWLG